MGLRSDIKLAQTFTVYPSLYGSIANESIPVSGIAVVTGHCAVVGIVLMAVSLVPPDVMRCGCADHHNS